MNSPEADQSHGVILWKGSPDTAAIFTPWDLFWVPFSFLWTGFTINFLLAAPVGLPTLIGGAMLVVGIYLIAGRFFAKVYVKRRTTYWVTSEQAVISGPRRTYAIDLTTGDADVHIRQQRHHRTRVTFSSRKPRLSSLSFFRAGFANTGLDLPLTPGIHIPFTFYDTPADPNLPRALLPLTSRA